LRRGHFISLLLTVSIMMKAAPGRRRGLDAPRQNNDSGQF
jgi:hypothetical protein